MGIADTFWITGCRSQLPLGRCLLSPPASCSPWDKLPTLPSLFAVCPHASLPSHGWPQTAIANSWIRSGPAPASHPLISHSFPQIHSMFQNLLNLYFSIRETQAYRIWVFRAVQNPKDRRRKEERGRRLQTQRARSELGLRSPSPELVSPQSHCFCCAPCWERLSRVFLVSRSLSISVSTLTSSNGSPSATSAK